MNRRDNAQREAQQRARPPAYTIIHQPASSYGSRRQQSQQLKQPRPSKREMQIEARLSHRAELRDQRAEAKRRRQWMMTLLLIVLLVALIALARCNT